MKQAKRTAAKNPTGTSRTNISMDALVLQSGRVLMKRMMAPSFSNLVARLVAEKCLALGIGSNGKDGK